MKGGIGRVYTKSDPEFYIGRGFILLIILIFIFFFWIAIQKYPI